MQEDGEETKGLAKRAIAESLRRMSRLCGLREGGVDMLELQQRRWPDWCEESRTSVRTCPSILDRQSQSHGYGHWPWTPPPAGQREERFEVETR
jgi:hypothetical protein